MPVTLALPHLYDSVVTRFANETPEDETPIPNLFGWRTPTQKEIGEGGARIAWVPGNPDGELGELVPAKKLTTGNPRVLGGLAELFHVVINAVDTSDLENERKQYQAARELFDAWWRHVFLTSTVHVKIETSEWLTDKKVRRYGAAILVVCTIDAPIFDVPYEAVSTDAKAEIDVEELDNTETMTVPPEDE
jgi:hypothetical protein